MGWGARYPDLRILRDNSLLALKRKHHEKTLQAAEPEKRPKIETWRAAKVSVDVIAERLGRN